MVAYETELEDWGLTACSRSTIDQLAFARFASHRERSTGVREFRSCMPGADPPDLVVTSPEGRMALELTQLADPKRREAASRLAIVRERLDAKGVSLPRLIGWRIFVWTEDLTTPDFLRGRAEEVVETLLALEPRDHLMQLPADQPLPDELPRPALSQTPSGMRILAAPPGLYPLTTRFARRQGFDLGLAHTTYLTRSAAAERLTAAIEAKDRVENQALLITFGGFDHTGFRWPAESHVFHLLTSEALPQMGVQFLRHVYLHDWYGAVADVPLIGR